MPFSSLTFAIRPLATTVERENTNAGSSTMSPFGFLIVISQETVFPATTVAGAHVTDEAAASMISGLTVTVIGFVPDTNVASSLAVTFIVAAMAGTPRNDAVYEPMVPVVASKRVGRPLVTTLSAVLVETTDMVNAEVVPSVDVSSRDVGLSYVSRAERSQTRTLDPGSSEGQLNVDLLAAAFPASTISVDLSVLARELPLNSASTVYTAAFVSMLEPPNVARTSSPSAIPTVRIHDTRAMRGSEPCVVDTLMPSIVAKSPAVLPYTSRNLMRQSLDAAPATRAAA